MRRQTLVEDRETPNGEIETEAEAKKRKAEKGSIVCIS
jgi:hypothetical protein